MTKISDWTPKGIEDNEHYTKDQINEIVEVVNNPCHISQEKLRTTLNDLAEMYYIQSLWQKKPSPSEQKKEYERINKAAKKLLNMLGTSKSIDGMPYILKNGLSSQANIASENCGGYPQFPPFSFLVSGNKYLDYRGDEVLGDAIEGIRRLTKWAESAKNNQRNVVVNTKNEPSHKGNDALNHFISELAEVYREAFNKHPGVSRPSTGGPHGGPFLRFLQACLSPLNENCSIQALRERWRQICNKKQEGKRDKEPVFFNEIDE